MIVLAGLWVAVSIIVRQHSTSARMRAMGEATPDAL